MVSAILILFILTGWNASRHQMLTQNDTDHTNLASDLESLNIDAPFAPNGPEIEDKIGESLVYFDTVL